MRKYLIPPVLFGVLKVMGQPAAYRIVYNVLDDSSRGNYEIYIMDSDGKN